MLVIVAYDINTSDNDGVKRLNKISKECSRYGQRVQDSLFEMYIDWTQFTEMKNSIEKIIDVKKDKIRIYLLGNNYKNKVIYLGDKVSLDIMDQAIII